MLTVYILTGAERVTNNLLGWKLLLVVNEASNNWPGVEVTCRKSLEIMANSPKVTIPSGEDLEAYRLKMKLTRAKAFVYMGHDNHLREAVAILEDVSYFHQGYSDHRYVIKINVIYYFVKIEAVM